MTTPTEILDLVEHFRLNSRTLKLPSYNETQLRREFIDPMFKALGWDIDNANRYAEAYKDVVHEDSIRIGGAHKAPDYGFRVGGTRKFFLEAKRPSVNIKTDASSSYQLRRYAWSAKLPLSVLTDFEEFAVYDCRIKPESDDSASVARVLYMTLDDYYDKWESIASIFSREAVLRGSFDRYADDNKSRRGTATVDTAFLDAIEDWRKLLANEIIRRNRHISVRDLNMAVQRIIDRIIFLRIAEDRSIESYGKLRGLLKGPGTYAKLLQVFFEADKRYNSGLFHFREGDGLNETVDRVTTSLRLSDLVVKQIIKSLYYPTSPYEFSVISADILGQVYEQFLGHVISISDRKIAIEEKPDVKKAGGVYYTPEFVVRYIIEKTIGPLITDRTPAQVAGVDKRSKKQEPIRILDPACGSGSFLIAAYQFLLDWYLNKYVAEGVAKHVSGAQAKIYELKKGQWRLTINERRRILLAHIYGVDIDPQAVEVTKLSLLLKVLEGENSDAIAKQLDLFRLRALPDLGNNIKCGNSLISNDFYDQFDLGIFEEEQTFKVNAFNWSEFAFFNATTKFDVVIGNPPYGAIFMKEEKAYFSKQYSKQSYQLDSYLLFMERSISALLRDQGYFGMIIPNPWLTNLNQASLRQYVIETTTLREIVHFNFFGLRKS